MADLHDLVDAIEVEPAERLQALDREPVVDLSPWTLFDAVAEAAGTSPSWTLTRLGARPYNGDRENEVTGTAFRASELLLVAARAWAAWSVGASRLAVRATFGFSIQYNRLDGELAAFHPSAEARAAVEAFQADLARIHEEIGARNAGRAVAYGVCDPPAVSNSVNA